MITNGDIKKLKGVFATNDELTALEKRMSRVFMTKKDFQNAMEELIKLITGGFDRMDKAIARLDEHSDILNNHEHRLDKIEDKVFSTS
jgi:tetrahydromethanopterin S-methyltransferase subunit G